MNVFWKEDEITPKERDLLTALRVANYNAAMRPNPSSQAVAMCAQSGVTFAQAVASACSTLGGHHAPIEKIYDTLEQLPILPQGRIPGWGSSFEKGRPDPLYDLVDGILAEANEELHKDISDVTSSLCGKAFPNPGCYTAAVAITLGMPRSIAAYLFLSPRLDAWATIHQHHQQ